MCLASHSKDIGVSIDTEQTRSDQHLYHWRKIYSNFSENDNNENNNSKTKNTADIPIMMIGHLIYRAEMSTRHKGVKLILETKNILM